MHVNKLSLNIKKTKYMLFTLRKKPRSTDDIFIDHEPIEKVEDFKFLGVIIDSIWTPSRAQARALCFLSLFGVLGARPTHPVRLQAYMAKQAERWRGRPFPWSPSSRHGNKLYKQTLIQNYRGLIISNL